MVRNLIRFLALVVVVLFFGGLFLVIKLSRPERIELKSLTPTLHSTYSELVRIPEISLDDLESLPLNLKVRLTYHLWENGKETMSTSALIGDELLRWKLNDDLEIYMDISKGDYRLCSWSAKSAVRISPEFTLKYYRKFLNTFRPIPLPPPNILETEERIKEKHKKLKLSKENILGLKGLKPLHIIDNPTLMTTSGVVVWVIEDKKLAEMYWLARYRLNRMTDVFCESLGITRDELLNGLSKGELIVEFSPSMMRHPVPLILEDANSRQVIAIEVREEAFETPVDFDPCDNLIGSK